MRNLVVYIQLVTFAALSIWFFKDGLSRQAAAQLCYMIATAFLFLGVRG